jgi:hypothetical protein
MTHLEENIFMDFLHKLEPHLVSEDVHIQNFVLHILDDIHQFVPAEWTERLLKDAIVSKEKEFMNLIHTDKFSLNHGAVQLLIQGMKETDKSRLHLYKGLLDNLEPEIALEYQQELAPFIEEREWDFYRFLLNGEDEQIWEEYGSTTAKLETMNNFENKLYSKAKLLARTLMKKGYLDENEIDLILKEQLAEPYFRFYGIMAIYVIRLRKLSKYIPILVSLLDRNEDILLEEVADTLISFQSDEVVKMVLPYAKQVESSIFAISVLSGTKTAFAMKVLKELFHEVEYEDEQDLVFEALCHQLSAVALPEIEEYMNNDPVSFMIEIEETAYGYYKIMGIDHHDLSIWKQIADEKDSAFNAEMENDRHLSVIAPIQLKVGRNDPCPCGSGKKYKKCCGA